MRIEVDASSYTSASESLMLANGTAVRAYGFLTSELAGTGGMGGDDSSSVEFVEGYDASARELVGAIAELADAFGSLSTITWSSGANHRDANAASVYRGPGPGAADPLTDPEQLEEYSPPSALGGDASDAPDLWDTIVSHLEGWTWPSADTARLRDAATAWRSTAGFLDQTPARCASANSLLAGQRSPEIEMATSAISEVEQAAIDLSAECLNIAASCEEYADKVDSTKETVRGLMKDLAIEIGATAVIAGIGSAFTLGGAGLAGASFAGARAAAYAHRVISALAAIRAIRAIATLVRTVEKATDVRRVLVKFRSSRNMRRRPTGKLPDTGKPGSYGYDKDGNLLTYANSRPGYGKGQVDNVWGNAQDANGDVYVLDKDGNLIKIEWTPGQPRKNVWDMGHITGEEYRDLRDRYLSGEISRERFLQLYRDPDNYEVAHPGRNRSGIDEATPRRR